MHSWFINPTVNPVYCDNVYFIAEPSPNNLVVVVVSTTRRTLVLGDEEDTRRHIIERHSKKDTDEPLWFSFVVGGKHTRVL